MIVYLFSALTILYTIFNYLYNIFLIWGIFKINIGEYSIRRIKYSICENVIFITKH